MSEDKAAYVEQYKKNNQLKLEVNKAKNKLSLLQTEIDGMNTKV